MKNFKIALLLSVLFGLVSCIDAAPRNTTPKIPWSQEVINAWVGRPVSRILSSPNWGGPDKSYTISGKEYVVYVMTGTQSGGSRRYGSAYSYTYVDCTWTWEIRNGIIVGGSAAGPGCDEK